MAEPEPKRLVLVSDGGESLVEGLENEEHQNVLRGFAELVEASISDVVALPQFRHLELVQVEDGAEAVPSLLSLAFDDAVGDAEVDLDKLEAKLDIMGLLLGTAKLPEELQPVVEVGEDEEQGAVVMTIGDEQLGKDLESIIKRARLLKSYNDWYGRVEESLGEALDAAGEAAGEPSEPPLDPFDVIQAVVLQIVRVAGLAPPQPNLLSRGVGAVRCVLGAPRAALGQVTKRLRRAQKLWWRLEDVVVEGGKAAVRLAVRSARPALIVFVLHRTLRTLSDSRSMSARLERLPTEEAQEYYYSRVLGADWRRQMKEDMDRAVQDVNAGLVTDEINEEKRLMTAAQLRRMEIEDWDKQRMKNFYLSSFGGLRWFDSMEQALRNPLFLESRGWTDPVQNWVGRNKTFADDLPAGQYMSDVASSAIALKEAELGRALSPAERAKVLERGSGLAGGLLPLGSGVTDMRSPAAVALAAGGALIPRS